MKPLRFIFLSLMTVAVFITALHMVVSGEKKIASGCEVNIDNLLGMERLGRSLKILSKDNVKIYEKVYQRSEKLPKELPPELFFMADYIGEKLLSCDKPSSFEDFETLDIHKISPKHVDNCIVLTVAEKALVRSGREEPLKLELWKTAARIVKRYSESEIVRAYLQNVYMQKDTWGLEAASKLYFGREVRFTSIEEKVWLMSLASLGYLPSEDEIVFNKRYDLIAYELYRSGKIKYQKFKKLQSVRLTPLEYKDTNILPGYVELVLKEMDSKRIDRNRNLTVHSNISVKTLEAANKAISQQISKYPEGINVAMAVVNYKDGGVEALAANDKWLYRTTRMRRQIGSTFKPIVYLTAITEGAMPNEIIVDKGYRYHLGNYVYAPANFEDYFMGAIPMRLGLVYSLNNATIRLAKLTGLRKVSNMAMNLGMKARIKPYLAMPLGIFPITPLNLAKVYGTFGNYGLKREIGFISYIENDKGEKIYMKKDMPVRVAPEASTYQTVYIMKDVVRRGTARNSGLIWGTAAKTGTTDEYRDAWTVALFPPYAVVCWVGFDDHRSMGEKGTGGGRAAPVIAKFQKELLGNLKRVDFDVPEGVVFKRVNARTGRVSGEGCSSGRSYLEAFKKENAPDSCYQKKVDRGLLTQRDNRG